LGIALEAIHGTLSNVHRPCLFCPCAKTLLKAEFKSGRLINLEEKISRQPSIQTVAWGLLSAFKITVKTVQQKGLKNLHFTQQGSCKVGAMPSTTEEIRAIKKKSSTLQRQHERCLKDISEISWTVSITGSSM
jgi:hypothetical protein